MYTIRKHLGEFTIEHNILPVTEPVRQPTPPRLLNLPQTPPSPPPRTPYDERPLPLVKRYGNTFTAFLVIRFFSEKSLNLAMLKVYSSLYTTK